LSAARLRALHEAVLAIDRGTDDAPESLTRLVTSVVARAVEALGATGGAIGLVEDPAWAALVPGTGPEDGHVMLRSTGEVERRRHRSGGTALRALAGEAVHVVDTADATHGGIYDWLAQIGVRSFSNVPLRGTQGRVLGALFMNFGAPGDLSAEDRDVLGLFAAHAAQALERARSAEERATRARMEGALLVARTVAHEINNAMAPIVGYAELLSLSPVVAADEKMVAFARRILWASTDVAEKVKQLQKIIRLEETESPLGPDQPVLDLERSTAAP
jgi:GAF domain-containing protein